MKHLSPILSACALLLLCGVASAQRELSQIPKPDVSAELEGFTVAEGFEVNLFASDPEIANPIHMNFDAQGRLWVVSSAVYPHIGVGETANDRVIVLQDTTGDGVADTSTVFAEGLFIPTGILPGDGGVYVANSTELLHLRDTDGDGKADRTRVVLSGFGTEDTHHILHTLRWGPDGSMFMSQSIYIHSHVETPHGVKRLDGGGIWQFRPETLELSVFARGFVNTWGHAIDAWGQSFATDGAYHEGVNYVFPGAAFLTGKSPRILKGLSPGSPKHCGLEVVSSRHFPDDWQGNMITNDFRGHRVNRFVINDNDGVYSAIEMEEVLKTDHVAFRPVDVKMGMDGALYIADWYNPIIQHGEVDFRDERRDRQHGRIWRVTAKDRPLLEKPEIEGASTETLVGHLAAPEELTRTYAKRALLDHDAAAIHDALQAELENAENDVIKARLQREGFWLFRARGEFTAMANYVADPQQDDPRDYAANLRLVHAWSNDAEATIREALQHPHPRVRLEALRQCDSLAETMDGAALGNLILSVMDHPLDENLDYALWFTLRKTAAAWLPSLDASQWPAFAETPEKLLFALQAVDRDEIVQPAIRLLNRTELSDDERRHAALLAAAHGDSSVAVYLVQVVLPRLGSDTHRTDLLKQLQDSARRRDTRPREGEPLLAPLFQHKTPEVAAAAIELAGAWRVEALRDDIEQRIRDDEALPAPVLSALYRALTDLGGDAAVQFLRERVEAAHTDRIDALLALSRLDLDSGANYAADMLGAVNEAAGERLVRAYLQIDNGPTKLAEALSERSIPRDVAMAGQRVIRSSGQAHDVLLSALEKAGGLDATRPMPEGDALLDMVAAVREKGDPARGEIHYRALDCAMCHAIGGAGSKLGPDMTSIGASAQIDYLIESLLAPNDAIKEGFHSKVISTYDFEVFSGIPTGQTDTELILRDATDAEIRIPFDNIQSEEEGQSLMPAGLTDTLLEDEFIDLVAFLAALGREQQVGTARVVRTWKMLTESEGVLEHLNSVPGAPFEATDGPLVWGPVYSRVSGVLHLEDVVTLKHPWWSDGYSYLQFTLEVSREGVAAFALDASDGIEAWVNGVAMTDPARLRVPTGTVTVGLRVNRSAREGELRLGVDEDNSTAVFQILGGR